MKMRFALVDEVRREPEPGLTGGCPVCGSQVIAKCGEIKVWHWAHRSRRRCDPWWENETEWHRSWKSHFPDEWQERIQHAADGERHVADVKTAHGWVLEFQRSAIKPEERRARESFYGRMVWVVDGRRLEKALDRFARACRFGSPICPASSKLKVPTKSGGALLRTWVASGVNVFFDVGDPESLWWLAPESSEEWAYVEPFSINRFVRLHLLRSRNEVLTFDLDMHERRHYIASIEKLRQPEPVGGTQTDRPPHPTQRRVQRTWRL
jgi:competence protein CoiA